MAGQGKPDSASKAQKTENRLGERRGAADKEMCDDDLEFATAASQERDPNVKRGEADK